MRHGIPAATALAATVALAACGEVRSVEPALGAEDAIAMPALVGRWAADTTGYLEVQPVEGNARLYRVHTFAVVPPDSGDGDARADTTDRWEDAFVGRIGGRLVLELRPSRDDAVAQRAESRFGNGLLVTHQLMTFDLAGDSLRLAWLRADSAKARLRRGACAARVAGDTSWVLLTGTTPQVRRAYACFLRGDSTTSAVGVVRRVP